jgi:hypothetical protein
MLQMVLDNAWKQIRSAYQMQGGAAVSAFGTGGGWWLVAMLQARCEQLVSRAGSFR